MGINLNTSQKDSNSKFRLTSKICEIINKNFGIRCELNALLSPTINDVRKLLISIQNKGMMDDDVNQKLFSINEQISLEKEVFQQKRLNHWYSKEWILPMLSLSHPNKLSAIEFSLDSDLIGEKKLKRQLLINNFNNGKNLYSSFVNKLLQLELCQSQNKKYDDEDYQGQFETLKNNRKNKNKIIQSKNKVEWNMIDDKKTAKILKRKKEESDQEIQKQTLFNLQVNLQKETEDINNQKHEFNQIQDTNIESIKKKNREELDVLMKSLVKKMEQLSNIENKKVQLEEQNQNFEEQIHQINKEHEQLQKEAQSKHNLLQYLENDDLRKQLEIETQNIQNDVNELNEQWEQSKQQLQEELEIQKAAIDQKKERFQRLKNKIINIDKDYEQLNIDIGNNEIKIEALQEQYKNAPKAVTRGIYIKKMKDLQTQLAKQQEQFGQITKELQELDENIKFNDTLLNRHYTEIENALVWDPKKADSVVKQIITIYQQYRQAYDMSMQNLKQIGNLKLEQRQIEIKIDLLQSKNYAKNIEELQINLQEILEENSKYE